MYWGALSNGVDMQGKTTPCRSRKKKRRHVFNRKRTRKKPLWYCEKGQIQFKAVQLGCTLHGPVLGLQVV